MGSKEIGWETVGITFSDLGCRSFQEGFEEPSTGPQTQHWDRSAPAVAGPPDFFYLSCPSSFGDLPRGPGTEAARQRAALSMTCQEG